MAARNLTQAFDECLTAVLEGRRSIEECLALYPQWAPELEPLLRTALELSGAFAESPSPEFVREARQRFLAALARRKAPVRSWRPLLRWAPAAVGGILLIAILATVGTIVLNRDEGPVEPVGVRLVSAHLQEAEKNLQILESALERGEPVQPEVVRQLRLATDSLLESLKDAEALPPEKASAIVEVLSRQIDLLASVKDQLPQEEAEDASVALELSQQAIQQLGVTPTPEPTPVPPQPTATPRATPQPIATPRPTATPVPLPGSITIVKDTDPLENVDTVFEFYGDLSGFTLGDDQSLTFDSLEPGAYAITEIATTGWSLTDITCMAQDYEVDIAAQTVIIHLQSGEDVECLFNNLAQSTPTPTSP